MTRAAFFAVSHSHDFNEEVGNSVRLGNHVLCRNGDPSRIGTHLLRSVGALARSGH